MKRTILDCFVPRKDDKWWRSKTIKPKGFNRLCEWSEAI